MSDIELINEWLSLEKHFQDFCVRCHYFGGSKRGAEPTHYDTGKVDEYGAVYENLWGKCEELGFIECIGSWKWKSTDKFKRAYELLVSGQPLKELQAENERFKYHVENSDRLAQEYYNKLQQYESTPERALKAVFGNFDLLVYSPNYISIRTKSDPSPIIFSEHGRIDSDSITAEDIEKDG